MDISIKNNSDTGSNLIRNSAFSISGGGMVIIDGAESRCIPSNNITGFSGYFLRLTPGLNNIEVTLPANCAMIMRIPIARWIT